MRICKKCGIDLEETAFYPGRQPCIECTKYERHDKLGRKCVICHNPIPFERHGKHTCSDKCRKIRERRRYAENGGKEKAREKVLRRRIERPDSYRQYKSRINVRRSQNIKERIGRNMRTAISKAIGGKVGHRITEVLGYDWMAFRSHMEALFEPGMSWSNYGEWQIDHVVPLSWFNFKTTRSGQFRKAWALANLAPRWRTTEIARRYGSSQIGNIEKLNHFSGGGFQPSLFEAAVNG